MKLSRRLLLYFALVIALGSLSTYVSVARATETVFKSYVFEGDAQKARFYATLAAEYYEAHGAWEGIQAFLATMPELLASALEESLAMDTSQGLPLPPSAARVLAADRIAVADASGHIVADSSSHLLGSAHPETHLSHGIPVMIRGRQVGTLLVGSMIDSSLSGQEEVFLGYLRKALVFSALFPALAALILGFLLSARVVKPIKILSQAARRIAEGDLSTRVPASGDEEIAELAESFNSMGAELSRLDESRKRLIADSAHELRTPLTLIQGSLEAMLDGVYPMDRATIESVHEETLRLSRLVDTLRELELIDSGQLQLDRAPLDLSEAITKALMLFAPQAVEAGLLLGAASRIPKSALVLADAFRIDEILYNLLSNAMKYVPSGGSVALTLASGREGFLVLSVEDSGPGIPPEERERIFERFYRMDKSRSSRGGGRGLGLSIAKEIAEAHGGCLWVEESGLGGSAFRLELPVFRP